MANSWCCQARPPLCLCCRDVRRCLTPSPCLLVLSASIVVLAPLFRKETEKSVCMCVCVCVCACRVGGVASNALKGRERV
ncbi:hypothetical_protein [Leishmania major strain Friedlin]|nr:hypothetical_protein [Leishmania major strain Friedlin]